MRDVAVRRDACNLAADMATALDGPATAADCGLRYVRPYDDGGFTRKRAGKGFTYTDARGRRCDARTVARIRSLAIPPAWQGVWIARDPRAHIQATGRDARNRRQYIYHPRWSEARAAAKYGRLASFCRALPALRRRIAHDLACNCLCRETVAATVIALIESGHLRVGNDAYARANGSYGATTLEGRHLHLHGDHIELAYRGKSGIKRRIEVRDPKLARLVRKVRTLPGRRLFQYRDGDAVHPISSNDVNRYLRDVVGAHHSAKDFRTWAATLRCALVLGREPPPTSKTAGQRTIRRAIAEVADHLGHTPTVCRASYVHPRILDAFRDGRLQRALPARLLRRTADVTALRLAEPKIVPLLARA